MLVEIQYLRNYSCIFTFINGEAKQLYFICVAYILFLWGSLTLSDLELVVGILLITADEGLPSHIGFFFFFLNYTPSLLSGHLQENF